MTDAANDLVVHTLPPESGSTGCALPRRRMTILFALWSCVVISCLGYLVWYSNAPGTIGTPPKQWPVNSAIQPSQTLPTLMMFIHPRCPCTEASLEELARVMAHCNGLAHVYAVFVRPPGTSNGWEKAKNWRLAAAIPGVHLFVDHDSVEARRFGATTSGHVELYDGDGKLRFSGGITGARSHAGDNAGADAVRSWLRRGTADREETFVFGCPLFSSSCACSRGDAGCHQ